MNTLCQNKKKEKIENLATILQNIAEPNRLKILCLLKNKERCVCEIWQDLKIPQNLASHHLKVLKNLDIVSSRKSGLNVFYKLNPKVINQLLNSLEKNLKSKQRLKTKN